MLGYSPVRTIPDTRRRKRIKPIGQAELQRRYSQGLDLWTGIPLAGDDAADWLALQAGQEEPRAREQKRQDKSWLLCSVTQL
jgi:hypothetical protein